MARQAVVGDGLPGRRVGDVLVVRGAHAGVAVEGAHADADRVGVVGIAAEQGRAAGRAEGLLEAVVGRVRGDELLAARDPEGARRGPGAERGRAACAALAAHAVAVAGVLGRGGELVANAAAHAATGERQVHAARVPGANRPRCRLFSALRLWTSWRERCVRGWWSGRARGRAAKRGSSPTCARWSS